MFETLRDRPFGGALPAGVWPVAAVPPPVQPEDPWHLAPDEVDAEALWPDELPTEPVWGGGVPFDDLGAEPAPSAVAAWECLAGIEDLPPSGMLALVLEELDLRAASDEMLVEAVAAWWRIGAWVELNASLAAAELSRRESMNPRWSSPAPADRNVAADELAMRLACSRRAAQRLVRDGRALDNELLLTAGAVRAGQLGGAQLRVICERLADRPGPLAWAVQEAVLPGAATRTPRQLAADVDRELLRVDAEDAADRLARARSKRHVCHPRPLPDGMAGIWAVVPAADAVQVDGLLEATARAARAAGDPHTVDQIRTDTFTGLLTGRIAVLAPAADAVPLVAGAAPLVAGGIDNDDIADARGAATSAANVAAPAPVIRVPKVRINVTVALSTLMGLDDAPAELAGFGPIPADQARALATEGPWRRLVTDPLSGRVLDVGRARYRPPRDLVQHVVARDQVCAGPGCSTPAEACDLDHTTEYNGPPANGSALNGGTAHHNLGPLSHRCHRLKTDGGFTLQQVEPGVFEWRTPAGLVYRVVPGDHGRAERLRDRRTQQRRHPGEPNPGYPDEPPF